MQWAWHRLPACAGEIVISATSSDRLHTAPPLRKTWVCGVINAILVLILVIAALVHLVLFAGMSPDAAAVFFRALALSTLLSVVPVAILRFLDRRERESPWLLAAAVLWGGCIAAGPAAPYNAVFDLIVVCCIV